MDQYIGVTDFENKKQVLEVLEMFRYFSTVPISIKLMVGVMMSYKTLNDIPTKMKWEEVWVDKEKVNEIFVDDAFVLNTIHYADYDGLTNINDLKKVVMYGGRNLHAIQLDMTWPDPEMVIEFKNQFPSVEVVLQIGGPAFDLIGDDPKQLVKKLLTYKGSISYVLLDKSMGKGLGMDAQFLLPFIRKLKIELPHLGLSCGGGLGPKTTYLLEPVLSEFSDISGDAQGQLRPSGNILEPIDLKMTKAYVDSMLKLKRKYS